MHKRAKGNLGENVACLFLQGHGFEIVARNYAKKWGELDIVARQKGLIHFFEVKSVTDIHAGHFGQRSDIHRPEDNVDGWKVRHISRMIQTYIAERGGGTDIEFQFHVLCVYMDFDTRRARVKWVKNVIL